MSNCQQVASVSYNAAEKMRLAKPKKKFSIATAEATVEDLSFCPIAVLIRIALVSYDDWRKRVLTCHPQGNGKNLALGLFFPELPHHTAAQPTLWPVLSCFDIAGMFAGTEMKLTAPQTKTRART